MLHLCRILLWTMGSFLRDPYAERVNVPLTDPEADVTFYVKDRRLFEADKKPGGVE